MFKKNNLPTLAAKHASLYLSMRGAKFHERTDAQTSFEFRTIEIGSFTSSNAPSSVVIFNTGDTPSKLQNTNEFYYNYICKQKKSG